MSRRRTAIWLAALVIGLGILPVSGASTARDSIKADDLKEWLSYIASDELKGRATYSAGLDLAAAYIGDHLRAWGVKPAGDNHSFLQTVRVLGVKSTSRSSVTVTVAGETRTYHDGAGVTFPKNSGVSRALTVRRVEFAGYGLDVPAVDHFDFKGRDVRDSAVIWLGADGPKTVDSRYRRLLNGRTRYATELLKALATIGPEAARRGDTGTTRSNGAVQMPLPEGREPAPVAPDFTTTQRLDNRIAPRITASDAFLSFLFSKTPVGYEELKRRAEAREPLPRFTLEDVTITFTVDAIYEVVRTQLTQNVIGVVEGTDSRLKNTYVAAGAHYDHVGSADAGPGDAPGNPPGFVTPGATDDRIWNGADDDGSGTVALMALARAFANGPRPKRSLLFVWHAGEERGLLGSRYFADYPTIPLETIVAQLNIDMIGRNRTNKSSEGDTVYLVGSDRISSELHQISREANRALPRPLKLDYEMNDPDDVEQVYYRSDHYSYAVKGIPIIFFTTGLHADYHANTDEVSKIEFGKLTRVAQLVYETAARLANLDHPPARDNRGPRAGKDTR
jgi:Peptidase family M28